MQYRRAKTPKATYFFTVVTYNRHRILCEPENVDLLRNAALLNQGMNDNLAPIQKLVWV